MKFIYPTLIALILLAGSPLLAQCPPPGYPSPGSSCATAPVICADIDGYCGTTTNANQQPPPTCPGFVPHNDQWIAFVAGSTTIEIQFTTSNCTQSNNEGISAGIFTDCQSLTMMDIVCGGCNEQFTLLSSNYVVGQIYYLVIDNCGSACDYTLEVTQGSTGAPPPADAEPISGPNPVCTGTNTTFTTPAVSGATIYNWTLAPAGIGTLSNSTSNTVDVTWGNTPGTATLCVSTANTCSINPNQSCLEIELVPKPTAAISGSGMVCEGSGGSVDLTVTFTGTGPWTFVYTRNGVPQPAITTNDNPYTLTVTQPGTFGLQSVTAGCAGSVSGTATVTEVKLVLTTSTVAASCGLSNGSVNLSVTGGGTPYQFNWSNAETTEDLSNVPSGTYTVTVTDANGCTKTASATVANNNTNFTVSSNITAATTCLPPGNGSVDITVTPPSNTYTYEWSNGATTQDIFNVPADTYTLTISTGGNCSQVQSFTIPDQPNQPNLTTTQVNTTCGLSNGSINLSVSGGVAPYTFEWAPDGQTSEDLSNIPAGTYTVTVTGANGCTRTAEVTVANNNPPFTITPTIVANTTCNPTTGNGSISLSVSPAGSYTFLWDYNGATSSTISNLLPGTYAVTVSAGGACTQTADFVVPNEPNKPQLNFIVTNSRCELANGSINLIVMGGVPAYTYLWSPGGQTTQDLSNIPAGSYAVTITGANSCLGIGVVDVSNEQVPIAVTESITANTSCLPPGNGRIVLTTQPTTATVVWSHGPTSKTITDLPPGQYTATVTALAGGSCVEIFTYEVPDESGPPELFTNTIEANCGLPNGSIDLGVTNGVAPYAYKWSNGSTAQDLSSLLAGTYTVTVTTALGCTAVTTTVVNDIDLNISLFGLPAPNTSCTGFNGSVGTDIDPLGFAYQYKWSNAATTPHILNLAPGLYTVTVTIGKCSVIEQFEVENAAFPPNLSASGTATTCGQNNGTATATASGGEVPYKYKWSANASGATTQTVSNLVAGTYTVTVTGGNNCTATATVTIPNNNLQVSLSAALTENTSCVAGNGAIDLTAAPASVYKYLWSNTAATEDLTNLAAGTYTVTVTLGASCTSTAIYTITNNVLNPVISPAITASICGASNGAIDLSISGGTTPYRFLWSNADTAQSLANLSAGPYTVTVTAADGCTVSATFNVPNNSNTFTLAGATAPHTNCSNPNGSVNITVTPLIVPAGTYTYTWSNAAVTEDLNGLPAGTYTLTVSDSASGGCTASASYIVDDQRLYPTATQTLQPEICGLGNGSIDATSTGGTTPYTYLWSGGPTPNAEDLTGISAGTYTLTVTGANGCTATTSAQVPDNAITFSLSGNTNANTACAPNNGAVDLNVTPAGTYTFSWSNAAVTEDLTTIPGGNYAVTVSAGGTCTSVASFTVADQTHAPLIVPSIAAAACAKTNGSIDLSVSGGLAPFTFEWSNGPSTEDLANIPSGLYAITVTGANGCTFTDVFSVPENIIAPAISGTPVANTACGTHNGGITLSIAPLDTYTYVWSNGPTIQNLSNLPAGMYTVTVSGGGACISTATFEVLNQTDSPIISPEIKPSLCAQPNGAIGLTVTDATMPYTFQWSSGQTTEDISDIGSGPYTVTVSAANGCTTTALLNVPNNSNSFDIVGVAVANTHCLIGNGSVDLTVTPPNTYTFAWSNAALSEDLSGLTPGTYTVTATDPDKCVASATFVILEEAKPVAASGTKSDILCFGEKNGSIDLTVSVGTQPLTYDWSPAQPGNPQDLTNIPAGNYAVTVTDALLCTSTAAFQIAQPQAALTLACAMTKVVSQPGATDGAAEVNITGGTAPYAVTWSPGGNPQSGVSAGIFSIPNLGVGSYGTAVTDANGCPAECNFNIGLEKCETAVGTMGATQLTRCGPGCISASYSNIGQYLQPGDVLQFVLHTGTSNQISGEIARSTQPTFCFDPTTMTYGTEYRISAATGNDDGSGSVLLSDYCTVVSLGTPLIFNEIPIAAITPPEPITCAALQVSLAGSSSIAGSMFDWKTSTGLIVGNPVAPAVQATTAGVYTLRVAANGCADTATVQVFDLRNDPKAWVSASPDDVLDCKIDEIILSGAIEGTVNANTVWTNNGQFFSSENPVKISVSGTYEFVILDTLTRCTDTAVIVINENLAFPPLFVNPPQTITCKSPTVTLSGGSPFAGILFRWGKLNGADTTLLGTGPNQVVSTPGTYVLIGVDPTNQCKNSAPVTVLADQVSPSADAGAGFTVECFGEIATLDGSASTGLPGFTFLWTTLDGQLTANLNSATPTISEPGTYTLLVTNPNGCTDVAAVVIAPEVPVPVLDIVQPRCFGDKGRFAIKGVQGGKPPFRYSLDGGQSFTTQSNFGGLAAGSVYNIFIVDSEGCTATTSVVLNEPTFFDIQVLPEIVQVALGDTYTIVPKLSVPASELGSIRWIPGKDLDCDTCLTPTFKAINTTYFKVMAEDTAGCPDEALFRIYVDKEPHVYIPNVFTPDKDGDNKVFMIFGDEKQVVKIRSFQIYSRWGEQVFEQYDFPPNSITSGWDGRHRGEALNPAVFVWYAEIEFLDGNVVLYKGDVTLAR